MRLEGFLMVVYIEYVLIDNFVIDYLLLKTTIIITGGEIKKLRIITGALFGAIVSLIFPLLTLNVYLMCFLKILVGITIVLIGVKVVTKKNIYVSCVIFIFLTFALGGSIMGLFSIFNIDLSSEFSIALMIIPAYVLIKCLIGIIRFFYSRKNIENFTYNCIIDFENKEIKCRGFLDTGNSLFYNGKPIVVVDKNFFIDSFGGDFLLKPFITFDYWTASGVSKMPLFLGQTVKFKDGKKEYFCDDFYLGVGNVPDKKILLHPSLMEDKYEQTFIKTKENNLKVLVK